MPKQGYLPTPQSKSRSAHSEVQREAQLGLGLNPLGGGLSAPTERSHPYLLILAAGLHFPNSCFLSSHCVEALPLGRGAWSTSLGGGGGVRPCLCGGKCGVCASQLFFPEGNLLLRGEDCTRLPQPSSLGICSQSKDAAAFGQPDPPLQGSAARLSQACVPAGPLDPVCLGVRRQFTWCGLSVLCFVPQPGKMWRPGKFAHTHTRPATLHLCGGEMESLGCPNVIGADLFL